jgi:hypothetical protein
VRREGGVMYVSCVDGDSEGRKSFGILYMLEIDRI